MRYAQIIMGPAGSGKSTYCSVLTKHAQTCNRTIDVVNLDPAAEYYDYETLADIRDLINLDDTMENENLKFGPNGGLIYCMEYLLQNMDWLHDQLQDIEDDYILFDCPGQIEIYTHLGLMRQFVEVLQTWNFHVCGVFLLDSQFLIEPSKFFSGTLAALSAMVNLEIPHVNVITKLDLLSKRARKQIARYLDPDIDLLLDDENNSKWGEKYKQLSCTIAKLVEDYSLVKFIPLNRNEEDSIQDLLAEVDNCIQYGEDLDCKTKDFEEGLNTED